MNKSLRTRIQTAISGAALGAALLIPTQVAHASGTVSLGHGVKCYWVLVSTTSTGGNVYQYVCRKGV